MTDRNGMLNTSSEWQSRKDAVNANDRLMGEDYIDASDVIEGSGIWFGRGEHGSAAAPDDRLGALPYGEYAIEEMRCEANEGYALWSDTFNVSRDTTETSLDIDLGTVDDEPLLAIATEAVDKADGDHVIEPAGIATVTDRMAYANLVPGKEYVLTGTLVDKQAAKPVEKDGRLLAFVVKFTPEEPNGSVEVTFTFDGSALGGHTVVVFESLALEGVEVAVHVDINDIDQSVDLVQLPVDTPPSKNPPKSGLPQTGDTVPLIPLACIAGATACAVAVAALSRRGSSEDDEGAASLEKEE